MKTYEIAAVVVAAVLVIDALVHAYWLTGRTWPAADTRTLSRAVLNMEVPFVPRVLVPLVIVLLTGAAVTLSRAGLIGDWIPGWFATLGTIAVAAGLFVRAGAGLIWMTGIGAVRGSTFHRLNLVAYTPACIALSVAATVVAAR
jgi:4,5:9,10-diseco-3-hydroxy-5,9,17-trioxoandrosta-1(10),2-diene-4-oate hydrolase